MRLRSGKRLATLAVATIALATPAHANWLTHLLREAGEAGGKTAAHVPSALGPVGRAAAHLKSLTGAPKGALAAHATTEGHWQFVNREGQTFTAGTVDEMKRVVPALVPEAAGDAKLTLYLSEDSVFANRAALDQIPRDADLFVVARSGEALVVTRSGGRGSQSLTARLRPNLTMALSEPSALDEALYFLKRRQNKADIRTLALEPGATKPITSAPKLDAASRLPAVDVVDPDRLAAAMRSLGGQTVVMTGRIEGGKFICKSSSGASVERNLEDIAEAARAHDVNLVVLANGSGLQAGTRNWLWQTIEVGGLRDAAETATYGDFLDALAARRGGFGVAVAPDGAGRVRLTALPEEDAGMIDGATNTIKEWTSDAIGEVATNAVQVFGRDQESQAELDGRLIPGIPTAVQIPYLVGLIAGLLSWATTRSWWKRLWPAPAAPERGRIARLLRRIGREALFLLAFLPITGLPAFFWGLLVQLWNIVTAPFRWIRKKLLAREA